VGKIRPASREITTVTYDSTVRSATLTRREGDYPVQVSYAANYNMVSDPVYDDFYARSLAARSGGTETVLRMPTNASRGSITDILVSHDFSLCQPGLKATALNHSTGWRGRPSMLSFMLRSGWIKR